MNFGFQQRVAYRASRYDPAHPDTYCNTPAPEGVGIACIEERVLWLDNALSFVSYPVFSKYIITGFYIRYSAQDSSTGAISLLYDRSYYLAPIPGDAPSQSVLVPGTAATLTGVRFHFPGFLPSQQVTYVFDLLSTGETVSTLAGTYPDCWKVYVECHAWGYGSFYPDPALLNYAKLVGVLWFCPALGVFVKGDGLTTYSRNERDPAHGYPFAVPAGMYSFQLKRYTTGNSEN